MKDSVRAKKGKRSDDLKGRDFEKTQSAVIVLIKYTVPPLTVLLAEQGTRIFLERPSQQKGLSGGIIICHFLISAGPSSPFLILVMGRCHRVSCVVIYSTGRRQSYRYSGNSSGGALVTR